MDKNICHFTLAEANSARKIVGKKQMDKIPDLRQKVLDNAASDKLGQYVWKYGAGPQMGYSFSVIHALAYSFIGAQTLYLATHWNPIYWDAACLVVNSGSLEDEPLEITEEDIYEPEDYENYTYEDYPDKSGKTRKSISTDYGKIAKALGEIISAGINISLVDINKSDFGFKPDVNNNQILFGMKALLNVNDELVNDIIANRPYTSPKDFYIRVKPKKQAMISLIKAGAFDNMIDRRLCMGWFIWEVCDKKNRLTLQNMPTLIKRNMLPLDTEERQLAFRVYEFNRFLKACCIDKNVGKSTYFINDNVSTRVYDFLTDIDALYLIQENLDGEIIIVASQWDKLYQKYMDVFRNWLTTDGDKVLQQLNDDIFKEEFSKYADGSLSKWEMEVLCFYYHTHELANVNFPKYGLADFFNLPEEPVIERTFTKGKKVINMFKLSKIAGTCIAKNKTKSTVTLLTTTGVVNVKFRKEYFALFDKQISEKGEDGKKHVVEKSWFNRGSMIVVQGIRSGDDFIAKKYASSSGHQLYKITEIEENGDLVLQDTRYKGEEGE